MCSHLAMCVWQGGAGVTEFVQTFAKDPLLGSVGFLQNLYNLFVRTKSGANAHFVVRQYPGRLATTSLEATRRRGREVTRARRARALQASSLEITWKRQQSRNERKRVWHGVAKMELAPARASRRRQP